MTIQLAILGLLSRQPLSGYDLKKIISDSEFLYWSGNNNQIYHSLVQLHKDGLVSQKVELQESLPARKVYTITEKGLSELRQWVLSTPQLPERHHSFLVQLASTGSLSDIELDDLLSRYEAECNLHLQMLQEKIHRQTGHALTRRDAFLNGKIDENILIACQFELYWVREIRKELMEEGSANELSAG
jgi:PadR family transcriptional regulator AphA